MREGRGRQEEETGAPGDSAEVAGREMAGVPGVPGGATEWAGAGVGASRRWRLGW